MLLRIFLCYFVSLGLLPVLAAQSASQILHPALEEAFLSQTHVEAIILFQQQSKLLPADTDALVTKPARGLFVYDQLQKHARATQARTRAFLDGEAVNYRSFSVANAISATLTADQARTIGHLPGIAVILPNPQLQQDLGWRERNAAQARQAIEWGVERVGAPQLWAQGFTGQGIVVGGQDTGYDFTHPALFSQYRGTLGNGDTVHDYNWHDAIHSISPLNNNDNNPCGLDVAFPCDDNNHGTHTMGTMVGDDGQGNQIGVAPGASWMACRNMERGWGSPASYLECFEWFLAPTRVDGSEPDPTKAPHVIANSWSCPEQEGCFPETFELFDVAINNLRAAGVVVVTSAGNSGSSCGTVSTPPSIFPGAFAVGATSISDTIAGFSSRGPVTYNDSTFLQPQVVAPGVNVRSAVRNGGYQNFSGTSMSGPHTAGAVAVLLSAVPELAGQVAIIEQIFRDSALPRYSAQDCGDFDGSNHPNAVYGHGLINLETAYALAQQVVSTREPLNAATTFSLFPNPTSGQLTVAATNDRPITGITVTDLSGRELRRFSTAATISASIETGSLPAGVYLLQVQTDTGTSVRKFVKR